MAFDYNAGSVPYGQNAMSMPMRSPQKQTFGGPQTSSAMQNNYTSGWNGDNNDFGKGLWDATNNAANEGNQNLGATALSFIQDENKQEETEKEKKNKA